MSVKQHVGSLLIIVLMAIVLAPIVIKMQQASQETKPIATPAMDTRDLWQPAMDFSQTLSKPSAWVIQLATFSNYDNATRLAASLRTAGYAAYLRPVSIQKGKLFKVLVGPISTESNAAKISKGLQARFHLKGLVTKTFNALQD